MSSMLGQFGAMVGGAEAPGGGAISTGDLARRLEAELIGPADMKIRGAEALDQAGPGVLTFIRSAHFAQQWAGSGASAALVSRGIQVPGHDPSRRALLIVDDADRAMVEALRMFALPAEVPPTGAHPSAVVDPSAQMGAGARVGALCVVGAGAVLGDRVILHPRVVVGAGVTVGAGSVLHAGVVVQERCRIGAGCILHPNVVIGADGFGYIPAPDRRGLVKIPHIGAVELGDGVEVGAGSCIDRGKFGFTRVGAGTKIDNLVQIGHNAQIGRACVLCGQAGLAGSAKLGDGVMIGGQVGIADGVTIGDGARIGAGSGVTRDLPAGGTYLGRPAIDAGDALRAAAQASRLHETIRDLKSRLAALESAASSPGGHAGGEAQDPAASRGPGGAQARAGAAAQAGGLGSA